jgi:hypothetical protein
VVCAGPKASVSQTENLICSKNGTHQIYQGTTPKGQQNGWHVEKMRLQQVCIPGAVHPHGQLQDGAVTARSAGCWHQCHAAAHSTPAAGHLYTSLCCLCCLFVVRCAAASRPVPVTPQHAVQPAQQHGQSKYLSHPLVKHVPQGIASVSALGESATSLFRGTLTLVC